MKLKPDDRHPAHAFPRDMKFASYLLKPFLIQQRLQRPDSMWSIMEPVMGRPNRCRKPLWQPFAPEVRPARPRKR
ncbi:MAG: hypothetical protein ACU841_01410 [Gammaproteobacteria bacterium]